MSGRTRASGRNAAGALLATLAILASVAAAGCSGGEAPGVEAAPDGGAAAGAQAARTLGDPAPSAGPPGGGADADLVRAPASDGEVLLVSVEEVHAKLAAGAPVLLVDARGRNDFADEHLPGAVNVPLPTIAAAGTLPGVPRDHEIVVYCIAESCPISRNAARLLGTLGYTNVKDMRAGLMGWKAAGFPTERGAR